MNTASAAMAESGTPPAPAMAQRIPPFPGVKVALRRASPDLDPRKRAFPVV